MKKIYHYHPDTGALMGEGMADADPLEPGRFLIPANATTDAPPAPGAGQFVAWNGAAWELRAVPPPEPEPPPYVPSRADVIRGRLAQIDTESIRALRATVAASAHGRQVPQLDANKLDTLETEAAALRAEQSGLPA